MDYIDELRREADELSPQLIAWRRDLHMHPEIGLDLFRTAGVVAEHLRDLGLEVSTGIGKTGVVAMIEPDNVPDSAPVVMLRFDMDALPIHEQNDVPYRSQIDGAMHACGHDGHTAIGMGVAQLLTRRRNQLAGRVKLVFQPGEEGHLGAQAMIRDGVMENPKPAATFGLHVWSRLPLNQIAVQPGPLWAAMASFTLTVHGKGGHGAAPHEAVDAIMVASQIVVAWQSVVARSVAPAQSAVVSVGSFHSGSAFNIIAESAELVGTIRSFSPDTDALLRRRMREIADGICAAFGASAQLAFSVDVPTMINSEAGAALMGKVATELAGAENVIQIEPMMVAEDVSEFLNRAPGCYVLIGASDPAGEMHSPHHNATFDFDERVLPTGTALIAATALAYLDEQAH